MDSAIENRFMQLVRINPAVTNGSVSLVINKQGLIAGKSTTVPDAAELVAAAKTPVKKGCGTGFGPAGCGK